MTADEADVDPNETPAQACDRFLYGFTNARGSFNLSYTGKARLEYMKIHDPETYAKAIAWIKPLMWSLKIKTPR